MKNKTKLSYIGYLISALLVLLLCVSDFPSQIDLAVGILFTCIFSISHSNLMVEKMVKRDHDFKVEVMDERNIAIKEKAGNITNMITVTLLGLATVIFIALDYTVPAVITGVIIFLQPVLLILTSTAIEKQI